MIVITVEEVLEIACEMKWLEKRLLLNNSNLKLAKLSDLCYNI